MKVNSKYNILCHKSFDWASVYISNSHWKSFRLSIILCETALAISQPFTNYNLHALEPVALKRTAQITHHLSGPSHLGHAH